MRFPEICALFLIFLLLVSGCSSETRSSSQTPAPAIAIPLSIPTSSSTLPGIPARTPAIPADPILGTWMCYSYQGGDRTEKVYTFQENNTWTRIDRDLTDRTKAFSHGTWKNGGNNQYPIRFLVSGSSGTFGYDMVRDELYDPYYQETFHRTADTGSSAPPSPVFKLTLNSEQKVSRLGNFRPLSEKIFLIVNVTIRNINETEGYSLDESGIHVVYDDKPGISSENGELGGPLENPFLFGTIAPGETRQGEVIFAVPKRSNTYTMKLVDPRGDDTSNIIIFHNITAI